MTAGALSRGRGTTPSVRVHRPSATRCDGRPPTALDRGERACRGPLNDGTMSAIATTRPSRWAGIVAVACACGGGTMTPPATSNPIITFSATGLKPSSVAVPNGGCVLVQNADASDHVVEPDDLQACPELLGSTTLSPGHDWDWCGFRGGPKSCGFHDPTRKLAGGAQDPAFSATIQVGAP